MEEIKKLRFAIGLVKKICYSRKKGEKYMHKKIYLTLGAIGFAGLITNSVVQSVGVGYHSEHHHHGHHSEHHHGHHSE